MSQRSLARRLRGLSFSMKHVALLLVMIAAFLAVVAVLVRP